MKKKLLSIVSLVLCVLSATFLFTGCGEAGDVFVEVGNVKLYNSMSKIEALNGYVPSNCYGDILLLTKSDNANSTRLYNLKNNAVVADYESTTNVTYDVSSYGDCIIVRKSDTASGTAKLSTTVYDLNGNKVFEEVDKETAVGISFYAVDLFTIGNDYYRVDSKTKKISLAFNGENKTLPNKDDVVNLIPCDYYTVFDEYNGRVLSYDKSFNLVYSYLMPTYGTLYTIEPLILDNGNYIIQYAVRLSDTDNNYDYLNNYGYKYDLITKLINPGKKSVSDIGTEYILNGDVATKGMIELFPTLGSSFYMNADAMMAIDTKIVDKYLSNIESTIIKISNDGNIEKAKCVNENQADVAMKLPNGNFYIQNVAGQELIVNGKGEIIKEFEVDSCETCYQYAYKDGVIYNFNFDKIADASEYTYVETLSHVMVFSKVDEGVTNYYLFDGKNFVKACAETDLAEMYSGMLCAIKISDTQFDYVNGKGVKIGSLAFALDNCIRYGENVILSGLDGNNVAVVYIVK